MSTDDQLTKVYDAKAAIEAAISSGAPATATNQYELILSLATGHSIVTVKQLCVDTLPLYVHHFPALSARVIEAQIDLCADDALNVRIKAIKGLELICKALPSAVSRIASICAELLLAEDVHELAVVKSALTTLLNTDFVATFNALIVHIKDGDENIQAKVIDFITARKLRKDVEGAPDKLNAAVDGIKSILESQTRLTDQQFSDFIGFLVAQKTVRSSDTFAADIGKYLSNHAQLELDFNPTNEVAIKRFLNAVKLIATYKKFKIDATPYVQYFVQKIIPVFDSIDVSHQVILSRVIATRSKSVDAKTAKQILPTVWTLTKTRLAALSAKSAFDESDFTSLQIAEYLLALTHHLSAISADAARDTLGLFTATGQPADNASETKRASTVAVITNFQSVISGWQKTLNNELPALNKQMKESTDQTTKAELRTKTNKIRNTSSVIERIIGQCKPLTAKNPDFRTDALGSRKETPAKATTTTTTNPKQQKAKKTGAETKTTATGKQQPRRGNHDSTSTSTTSSSTFTGQPGQSTSISADGGSKKRKRNTGSAQTTTTTTTTYPPTNRPPKKTRGNQQSAAMTHQQAAVQQAYAQQFMMMQQMAAQAAMAAYGNQAQMQNTNKRQRGNNNNNNNNTTNSTSTKSDSRSNGAPANQGGGRKRGRRGQ